MRAPHSARNHLLYAAGPLIDLKRAVDKVVCHHGTWPRVPTKAFSLKDGFLPERPYVSIHLNSARQTTDPIEYFDFDAREMNSQMVLSAIKVPQMVKAVDTQTWFDVHRTSSTSTTMTGTSMIWVKAKTPPP